MARAVHAPLGEELAAAGGANMCGSGEGPARGGECARAQREGAVVEEVVAATCARKGGG